MPPWARRATYRKCIDAGRVSLVGAWADIGEGECQRCKVIRNLYQPLARPELAVCSPCSQIYATSGHGNHSRDENEDVVA